MRKLVLFENITLDGFFTGKDGDFSWAHQDPPDPEFQSFLHDNAKGGGTLAFGRKTYEMMASHWPTKAGRELDPVIARIMNDSPKIVFSKSLKEATWSNTRLVKTDPVKEVQALKAEAGSPIVIMGSGSIVALLARARLIDDMQMIVKPIAIGRGRPLFEGLEELQRFRLVRSRSFAASGNTFVEYARL